MSIRTPPTPHCHQDSLDTASTPEAFVAREVELGTGYTTTTDHGSMASCLRVYDLAKKNGLTPILGVEAYFRDDDCPILAAHGIEKDEKGTYSSYNKYYHITLHAQDAEAYEALVRELSAADNRGEQHGSERKPLMDWAQLEELGKYNVTFTSGCLVGMVQRHLLGDNPRPDIGIAYYQRLRSIAKPGNFYVEVFPHVCSHNWDKAVYLILEGGTKKRFWWDKKLKTQDGEITAIDLARRIQRGRGPYTLVAIRNYRTWDEIEPMLIVGAEAVEGYVQNECTPLAPQGDIQVGANHFVLALANQYGDKPLVSDDSHFATPDEKIIQDYKLGGRGGTWKFYGSYHRQSGEESWNYFRDVMGKSRSEFEGWVDNAYEWAEGFKGFELPSVKSLPAKFYPKDTLAHVFSLIEKHGRMRWDNPTYVARLQEELALLHENGTIDLVPYFFIGEEICDVYAQKGVVTGPGRGSAAGLLLTYLLGITHVDPIVYNLSVERFITKDRIEAGALPDIDQDLPERDTLVDPEEGYLTKRFGDHFAQISTDTVLRLKSSMKDICRAKRGFVLPEIEALTKRLPNPPQGIEDSDWVFGYESDDGEVVRGIIETEEALKEYIEKFPDDWKAVQKTLGITRQKSRHACGYVIADRPIHEFIPLTTISGVKTTQYTAKWVEKAGGVKIDLLGLNSLRDISDAVSLIQSRYDGEIPEQLHIEGRGMVPKARLVPVDGKFYDVWDLPPSQKVFESISSGRTETVFQFNTNSARQWLNKFNHPKADGTPMINSIEDMAVFTALDRPGPLDAMVGQKDGKGGHNMLVEYSNRARGLPYTDPVPELERLLPETFGVMVFQEQLQYAFQQLTGCTGPEAEQFRRDVAKKKVEEVEAAYLKFIGPASEKIGKEAAEKVWAQMKTFGQYGFCKAHAVSYSVIGYACAFLKENFPLEWWCAVLRNADKDEIATSFWQHCGHAIDFPDINLSGDNWEIQNGRIRAPLGLLKGIGPTAAEELNAGRPYSSIQDFANKIEQTKIEKTTVEDGKVKKGRSALNIGVVARLIVSGALNSMFEEVESDAEKIDIFLEAQRVAQDKKRKAAVPEKYASLDPLSAYQLKKSVLPIYSEYIVPMIQWEGAIGNGTSRLCFFRGTDAIPFVDGPEFVTLQENTHVDRMTVAVGGYVQEVRRFTYQGNKEAVEIKMDIGGESISTVRWPPRGSNSAPYPADAGAGAIVVVILNRWRGDRPFSVDDVYLVRSPLEKEK